MTWISVKDRLPERGVIILISYKSGNFTGEFARRETTIGIYGPGVFYESSRLEVLDHVTHWMPLPDPPEDESK